MILFKRTINTILLVLITNILAITSLLDFKWFINALVVLVSLALFIKINIFPSRKEAPTKRLKIMVGGYEIILLFMSTFIIDMALSVFLSVQLVHEKLSVLCFILHIVVMLLLQFIFIFNGLIRVFTTSVQLGIKWRVLMILLWWVPILNIILIIKLCNIVRNEYNFEVEKAELNNVRQESEICKTKYPILMVHGVFFRDMRLFNYWGRIPKELIRNGATIYYGGQQSAASVEDSGKELAERIQTIINETGCEKLNIIAHSKGGLDSRYAISCLGMDKYVASLTTINTPHRGCAFAEYLLNKAPHSLRSFVPRKYNNALKKLGDSNPDFLGAVESLTVKACSELNEIAKDMEGVYYQSVCSKINKRKSGRFPLNFTYLLVKKFDGDNDGLVSLESAKWGTEIKTINVNGKRGISHGDVIDLNREDIKGFDVREFYVELVKELKEKHF